MYQTVKIPLGTASYAAGGQANVDFKGLPKNIGGRIPHVYALHFDFQATPTLSSGTATIEELQKAVSSLVVSDGVRQLFAGPLAALRLFESLECGIVPTAEPDAAATTEAVNFARVLYMGLPNCADPFDFVMPAPAFQGGNIGFGFGALTDVDANCTALAMTVTVTAECTLHDELVFGSLLERKAQVINNGTAIGQEALYAFAGICNSASLDAITAGDLAAVGIDFLGFSEKQIHVAVRERMYQAAMQTGPLSSTHGEPRAATDDNPKVANGTAIAAASALVSPIIWTPPGGKLTKLVYAASPDITFNWSGTQSAAYGLFSRIIPRDTGRMASYVAAVEAQLGVSGQSVEARTLSKKPYVGPRKAYLPVKAKVG